MWYNQKVKGHCKQAYWPVHSTSRVFNPKNIYCGIETSPGYSQGNYIQAIGKIYIGDYTQIAPNVGIISANHELEDNRKHIVKDVKIGKYCWIGFGAVILPGVELGDYTIVGAGAIVTKSFKEGYCVLAGNPAKLVKRLNKAECIYHKSDNEYNGYIKNTDFEDFRKKNLNV
nr:acyltransferase [Winogradskyella flava]